MAVIVLEALIVTVQVRSLPLHAPLQLLNLAPLRAVAISLTFLPAAKR